MTDSLALKKFDVLQRELGFSGYTLDHRDFNVQPGFTRRINAVDMSYIILDGDDHVVVRSETGIYDRITTTVAESIHHHTGSIVLENHSPNEVGFVEFIVAIWF